MLKCKLLSSRKLSNILTVYVAGDKITWGSIFPSQWRCSGRGTGHPRGKSYLPTILPQAHFSECLLGSHFSIPICQSVYFIICLSSIHPSIICLPIFHHHSSIHHLLSISLYFFLLAKMINSLFTQATENKLLKYWILWNFHRHQMSEL